MKTYLQDVRNAVCNARLAAEELEAVIAPGASFNHNETFLDAEELEAVIAPGLRMNHNESLLAAPVPLAAEELEAMIAPARIGRNPATGE